MLAATVWVQTSIAYITEKLKSEEGQDFAEYAIILALVVIGAATAFTGLASSIKSGLSTVAGYLDGTI